MEVTQPQYLPTNIDRSDFGLASHHKPREFIVTAQNPDLRAATVNKLHDYISCKKPLPCHEPISAGRSIFSLTKDLGNLPDISSDATKSKGIQALVELPTGDFKQVFPQADLAYNTVPQAHYRLDSRLRMETVFSGLKALNSLLHKGANNEFDFGCRLAKVDAGFEGLLAVKFGTELQPEIDCFDQGTKTRVTGGVISKHDPESDTVASFVQFTWHRVDSETVLIKLPVSMHVDCDADFEDLIVNFSSIYQKVAAANSRAIFDAGIGRHSSVATNFFINQFNQKVYQTDLDTCINLSELPLEMRGPQVIRDVASALVKMTSLLGICALSPDLIIHLLSPSAGNIFYGPLSAYFAEYASDLEIRQSASRLQNRYVMYLNDRHKKLPAVKQQMIDANTQGKSDTYSYQESIFRFIMEPFLKDTILEIYTLLKDSRFESAGYPLPDISTDALNKQLFDGLMLYRKAIMKERGWGQPK